MAFIFNIVLPTLLQERVVSIKPKVKNNTKTYSLNQNSVSSSDVVWDRRSYDETGLGPKKIGLGLAGFVLRCETRSCHAHRHNDLGGHSSYSSTIFSFCILCFEHHHCVEINSGVHL